MPGLLHTVHHIHIAMSTLQCTHPLTYRYPQPVLCTICIVLRLRPTAKTLRHTTRRQMCTVHSHGLVCVEVCHAARGSAKQRFAEAPMLRRDRQSRVISKGTVHPPWSYACMTSARAPPLCSATSGDASPSSRFLFLWIRVFTLGPGVRITAGATWVKN